jgi:riboflavin synthase alpha subunit
MGRRVNIEFDLVGKYIENMLAEKAVESVVHPKLSIDRLKELGY